MPGPKLNQTILYHNTNSIGVLTDTKIWTWLPFNSDYTPVPLCHSESSRIHQYRNYLITLSLITSNNNGNLVSMSRYLLMSSGQFLLLWHTPYNFNKYNHVTVTCMPLTISSYLLNVVWSATPLRSIPDIKIKVLFFFCVCPLLQHV